MISFWSLYFSSNIIQKRSVQNKTLQDAGIEFDFKITFLTFNNHYFLTLKHEQGIDAFGWKTCLQFLAVFLDTDNKLIKFFIKFLVK